MIDHFVQIIENVRSNFYYFLTPLLIFLIYFVYNRRDKQSKIGNDQRPPCLTAVPILGSLPFIPNLGKAFLTFTDFRSKYGDVFAFYAGSRYTVVLNGHKAIHEAFVKKASDTASREPVILDKNYVNKALLGIAFIPFGEAYKFDRQVTTAILKDYGFGNNSVMEQRILAEITDLLKSFRKLNGEAFNPLELLMMATQNVICRLTLNERFQKEDASGKIIRSYTVSFFEVLTPILAAFPLARYIPRYRQRMRVADWKWKQLQNFFLDRMRNPERSGETNFCKEYKLRAGDNYSEERLVYILRDLIVAGTDSTRLQTSWMLILIGNHPQVKERLQREIDSVVPRDRLPSLGDKNNLPFLEAVILETMRFRTLAPISAPRQVLSDFEINGWKIPANSLLLANYWSAHMDPEVWSDPQKFRPERFLDADDNIINKDLVISFSCGRRSCIGEPLARQQIFLLLASIIQQFDILPPEGHDKIPFQAKSDLMYFPESYTLRFVPRFEEIVLEQAVGHV